MSKDWNGLPDRTGPSRADATFLQRKDDEHVSVFKQRDYACIIESQEIAAVARYIAKLEAQIATVAPAIDAQPVAWINSRDLQNLMDGKCRWAKAFTGVDGKPFDAAPVYASAQSEGFRKDAERYRWLRDVLRLDDVRWLNIANWNQANISAEIWDREIDAALTAAQSLQRPVTGDPADDAADDAASGDPADDAAEQA